MTQEKSAADALKTMPDGSDINDLPDWAFAHKQIIRDALKALTAPPEIAGLQEAMDYYGHVNDDKLQAFIKAARTYLELSKRGRT